jgi:hypothetical protein
MDMLVTTELDTSGLQTLVDAAWIAGSSPAMTQQQVYASHR